MPFAYDLDCLSSVSLIHSIVDTDCILCPGAQEPALHAGAEEPFLSHGGLQEEICRSITSCGNPQRCL